MAAAPPLLPATDALLASAAAATLVYPGDALDEHVAANTAGGEVLKGHGVGMVDDKLVSTTMGVLEIVNKLVSVRPLRARYNPQVGDVVVGRIASIVGRRWTVDVGARRTASLQLSAVSLPDGARRRRTRDDQNAMRALFAEGDLICAEVQASHRDGGVALHARGTRYGRLAGGAATYVHPRRSSG